MRVLRDTWLVCLGTTRDVELGMVGCPLSGQIDMRRCRECRFLEALPAEWRRIDCEMPHPPRNRA